MGSIVIFSDGSSAADQSQIRLRGWSEFLALSCDPAGFWIDASWPGDPAQLAMQIRTSPWWDRLAFTAAPCPSPLLDGQAALPDAALRCARAELAKASLKVDPAALLPAEKLLLYLAIRDKQEVLPQYDQAVCGLYRWPLADALGVGAADSTWFAQLLRSRFLSPVRLFDRIRVCRECGSGHLSYVDVCPECASIEIGHTLSLHCFTCGHVARKAEFEQGAQLVCPKCTAPLRHIGVDYDLPTAQHLCNQCGHAAIEPRIVASCFDCRQVDEPARLNVVEIHSYALNWRGLEALRHGQFHESFGMANAGAQVPPTWFRQMLLWATATHQRHGAMSFSLLLVELANTDDLLVQLGASQVHPMLQEFSQRMCQVLRASDVTSIDRAQRLWVLLPFTPPEAAEARLRTKATEIQLDGSPELAVRLKSFHAPRDFTGGENADSIMARLLAD